jgi:hypothetical protein
MNARFLGDEWQKNIPDSDRFMPRSRGFSWLDIAIVGWRVCIPAARADKAVHAL